VSGVQLLVMAKAPVPGRVKTRLCPPCTPEQAALVAEAALRDTLDAGSGFPHRTLVLSGRWTAPPGWSTVAQRGDGLGQRLAAAYHDTARPDLASLLVGMDTPQVRPELLHLAASMMDAHDAVLGPAADGGWWALGLRDPALAGVLRDVPMSTAETGELTLKALGTSTSDIWLLPTLHDVDTAADARLVARACPHGRFAGAVADHVPA
jgi:glycosyltransferase A (GT-A) superfamily protein (DUF2064 family)